MRLGWWAQKIAVFADVQTTVWGGVSNNYVEKKRGVWSTESPQVGYVTKGIDDVKFPF